MIDPKHPLYGATKVRDLTTGETFVACNCPNQPANKTLRFVASHRERFELAQTTVRRLGFEPFNQFIQRVVHRRLRIRHAIYTRRSRKSLGIRRCITLHKRAAALAPDLVKLYASADRP